MEKKVVFTSHHRITDEHAVKTINGLYAQIAQLKQEKDAVIEALTKKIELFKQFQVDQVNLMFEQMEQTDTPYSIEFSSEELENLGAINRIKELLNKNKTK